MQSKFSPSLGEASASQVEPNLLGSTERERGEFCRTEFKLFTFYQTSIKTQSPHFWQNFNDFQKSFNKIMQNIKYNNPAGCYLRIKKKIC